MSARGNSEGNPGVLRLLTELAAVFATLPQTRAFQLLADLRSYPPHQTVEIRARQLKPAVALTTASDPGAAIELVRFLPV